MNDAISNVVIKSTVVIGDRRMTVQRSVAPEVWATPDLKEYEKQELLRQLGEEIVRVLDPKVVVVEETT